MKGTQLPLQGRKYSHTGRNSRWLLLPWLQVHFCCGSRRPQGAAVWHGGRNTHCFCWIRGLIFWPESPSVWESAWASFPSRALQMWLTQIGWGFGELALQQIRRVPDWEIAVRMEVGCSHEGLSSDVGWSREEEQGRSRLKLTISQRNRVCKTRVVRSVKQLVVADLFQSS